MSPISRSCSTSAGTRRTRTARSSPEGDAPAGVRSRLPSRRMSTYTARQPTIMGGERAMAHERQFFIDGKWVDPIALRLIDVIDPATEEKFAQIAVGAAGDVDRA